MNQRLATKLATYTILVGILMGSLVSAIQIQALYSKSSSEISARAVQLIELTLDASAEAVYQLDDKLAKDLLNGLLQYELFLDAAIYDELGKQLAHTSRPRKSFSGLANLIEIKPIDFRYALPLRNGTKISGMFTASLDIQAGLQSFYDLAVSTAISHFLQAITLSLIVFLIVVYLITRPVGKLAKTLALIEPGSEDRLPANKAHHHDEIGDLINSANRYLEAASQYQLEITNNRKQVQDILDNLYEGVITTDKAGMISSVNNAAKTMFQSEKNELRGLHFCELLADKAYKGISDIINAVQKDDTKAELQVVGQGKNDYQFPIDLSVSLSNPAFALWTIKDISEQVNAENERLRLEEKLRQSQKMEAIGTLAGGIAHDFNNLLSGLTGFAELAQEEAAPNSRLRDNLDHVISISNQATQLVSQILTYSRKKSEYKETLDLVKIIEGCSSLIRQTIPATIEINSEYSNAEFNVFADETMMHQVMMNLYSNAAAAIGNQAGKISVSLELTEATPPINRTAVGASEEKPRLYNKIKLSDSGSGIAKENLHRIFEPYYTTKKQDAGTGMGLAMVHSIIENHQGWIEVESAPSGTSFSIYLPYIKKELSRKALDKPQNHFISKGNERILIVDDSQEITKMLSRLLSKRGYEIFASSDGNEAIAIFNADPYKFDLVITDQTMPGKNGDVIAVEMLAIRPELPIILCTGYSNYFTKESAFSLGIRRFMPKPVANSDLCEAIRELLDEGYHAI